MMNITLTLYQMATIKKKKKNRDNKQKITNVGKDVKKLFNPCALLMGI